jgi:hypothetical protein
MSPQWTRRPQGKTYANVRDSKASGMWSKTAPFSRIVRWRRVHAKRRLRPGPTPILPRTKVPKSASILMQEGVTGLVPDAMSAKVAEVPTPDHDALHAISSPRANLHQEYQEDQEDLTRRVVSRLTRTAWVDGLSSHPDKDFAAELIHYIDTGVPLLFNGPKLNQIYPNWGSCDTLRKEVKSSLHYDISRGWKVGPFAHKPFVNFVGSPMGAFSKPSKTGSGTKTRVIHDLSWPPDNSVNTYIPAELCSVSYVTIDTAVSIVKKLFNG